MDLPPSDKNVSEERKDSGSENESESSSSDKDQEQNSEDEGLRFANRREIASDHRFYDQTRYEALYSWLYYNHSLNGYMCISYVKYFMLGCHAARAVIEVRGLIKE